MKFLEVFANLLFVLSGDGPLGGIFGFWTGGPRPLVTFIISLGATSHAGQRRFSQHLLRSAAVAVMTKKNYKAIPSITEGS